jgi:hypothetical protein
MRMEKLSYDSINRFYIPSFSPRVDILIPRTIVVDDFGSASPSVAALYQSA